MHFFQNVLVKRSFWIIPDIGRAFVLFDILESLLPDSPGFLCRKASVFQLSDNKWRILIIKEELSLPWSLAEELFHTAHAEFNGGHFPLFSLVFCFDIKVCHSIDFFDRRFDYVAIDNFELAAIPFIPNPHQSLELSQSDKRCLSLIPHLVQVVRTDFPERLRMLAIKFVLHAETDAGVHAWVMQAFTERRPVGIRAHPTLNL